jgi:ankyrin repeat protein
MEKGYTALHCACGSGYKEIVEMLLERKADINAKDNKAIKISIF